MAKKSKKDELIIYGEPLTELPITGKPGVWYFYDGEYWFYYGGAWISGGVGRPQEPPENKVI